MPPAVAGGIMAGGALLGGFGANRAQKQQNKYARNAAGMLSPESIFQGAETLNPWLMGALQGEQFGQGGYGH